MNEFVSGCRHLLVPFLFHDLTSLHPPSFHRNDFYTCILRTNAVDAIGIQGVSLVAGAVVGANSIDTDLLTPSFTQVTLISIYIRMCEGVR